MVAVQAEAAAAYPASLTAGRPVPLERMATMADGIAVGCPGEVTFEVFSSVVDEVVTVSEDAMSRALLLCLERAKMVVEPAGVAAVAALLEEPAHFEPPVVAVLSGGNVDPVLLLRVIQHGMVAAGRYLSRPGADRRPAGRAGRAARPARRAGRERAGRGALPDHPRLHLGEVEVALSVETRGQQHRAELLAALRAAGHAPSLS